MEDINDILVVGTEVHEGWNTYDLSNELPQYSSYRLFNTIQYGCNNIAEIQLIGHEVLLSDLLTYDCPVEITQEDSDTKLLIETV